MVVKVLGAALMPDFRLSGLPFAAPKALTRKGEHARRFTFTW